MGETTMPDEVLTVGDLVVGMNVTVLEWGPLTQIVDDVSVVTQSRGLCGDVLVVKAIDLPYIVVEEQKYFGRISLDTRKATLMKLTDEYMAALKPDQPAKRMKLTDEPISLGPELEMESTP
jgi:hypothetical protein